MLARPNGLLKNDGLDISCKGPGPARRSTSSRVEAEQGTQRCPCGNANESRTHIVRECELYKEERYVLRDEENRQMRHGTLGSSEKTIDILGYRW